MNSLRSVSTSFRSVPWRMASMTLRKAAARSGRLWVNSSSNWSQKSSSGWPGEGQLIPEDLAGPGFEGLAQTLRTRRCRVRRLFFRQLAVYRLGQLAQRIGLRLEAQVVGAGVAAASSAGTTPAATGEDLPVPEPPTTLTKPVCSSLASTRAVSASRPKKRRRAVPA
ncbi:MAG: hypothetical protein R3E45_07730 [Rhodocyclaceae bacterium]